MSTITAKQVSELRERTGSGLMECKKALEAANGNIDLAIEAMRKAGQTKADKKSGRVAAEGVIAIKTSSDAKSAIILEINCETDFVARDENFKQFAELLASQALTKKVSDITALLTLPNNNGSATMEEARQALVAKIGENIQVRRAIFIESPHLLVSYIHSGRIGVLVELKNGNVELGKDIAMHIAANNPQVVAPNDVPADIIAKEKEIFMAQAQASGKPLPIIEKMVDGRIKKFLDETSLLGQPFVKNPDITVAQLLKQSNAEVIRFIRFGLGEGIEKTTENFAEAVMAQVRGN